MLINASGDDVRVLLIILFLYVTFESP